MTFPQMRIGIEPKEPRNGEIVTCDEMRRRIHEAAHESALILNCLRAADYNGMSAEDRYTMLSYHALVALETYYKRVLDFTMKNPNAPVILRDGFSDTSTGDDNG